MKKFLLVIWFAALACNVSASHLMGGNIVVKYDTSAVGYLVSITYYRDLLGGSFPSVLDYSVYKEVNGFWNLHQYNKSYFDSTRTAIATVNCPDNVEARVFIDTIITSFIPGKYLFENNLCCRSGSILNLNNPSTFGVEIYTELSIDSLHNSSPYFLLSQPILLPVNHTTTFSTYPFDIDNDSVTTHFCQSLETTNVVGSPTVIPGTQIYLGNPNPYGPIELNSITGQITWTPNAIGTYVHSSLVEEFRREIKIGEMIKDYQYIVANTPWNNPPSIHATTPYYANGNTNIYYYTPGTQIKFQVEGLDIDSNLLRLQCMSTLFSYSSPSLFTSSGNNYALTGTFEWTPPLGFNKDIVVVFRANDTIYSNDFVLVLRLKTSSVVNEFQNAVSSCSVYPNPTHHQLLIDIALTQDLLKSKVVLYSMTGQKVKTIFEGKIYKGHQVIEDDLMLPPGMYFVVINNETNPSQFIQRILIVQ